MTIYFDVESGPQSDGQLEKVMPHFKAPKNYKDADKIAAAICEMEMEWRDRAALSALTGEVLAIGLLDEDSTRFLTGPEPAVLKAFWGIFSDGPQMVGFNVKGWDLPFLCQRSWILGITTPADLMNGRWWHPRIIDVLERWCCYSNRFDGQSLGTIAKATAIGEKTGDGKDFATLFKADRQAALDYCGLDLELTAKLAARLGIS